ncbi:hypothetical protein [Burkholderia cepacia]|uniref:hypothetical protein n=1 Tax=Burkholderia cepacia TaxID=292 RepID=UPI002FDF0D89
MLEFNTDNGLISETAMIAPVPLTKVRDEFSKLVKLRIAGAELDELTLHRIEKVGKEGITVDPVVAYQLLGVAASCRWDRDGVDRYFGLAIDSGADHTGIANYSRSLCDINELSAAADQLEIASGLAPESLLYLNAAITNRIGAGEWSRARELFHVLIQRTTNLDPDTKSILDVIEFAYSIGIREETIRAILTTALRFLTERRVRFIGLGRDTDRIPGDECVYIDMYIGASREESARLDDELTPILFSEIGDLQLSRFGFSINSYPEAHESN